MGTGGSFPGGKEIQTIRKNNKEIWKRVALVGYLKQIH
jgi:hypothetical protein